jgi:hypothetical protein
MKERLAQENEMPSTTGRCAVFFHLIDETELTAPAAATGASKSDVSARQVDAWRDKRSGGG